MLALRIVCGFILHSRASTLPLIIIYAYLCWLEMGLETIAKLGQWTTLPTRGGGGKGTLRRRWSHSQRQSQSQRPSGSGRVALNQIVLPSNMQRAVVSGVTEYPSIWTCAYLCSASSCPPVSGSTSASSTYIHYICLYQHLWHISVSRVNI